MINGSDYIFPPVSGGVEVVALGVASAALALPVSWQECFVTLTADGGPAWVLFGAAGVVVDRTATAGATRGVFIAEGASLTCLLRGQSHLAYQSSAAAGYLRIWKSSTPGGNQ